LTFAAIQGAFYLWSTVGTVILPLEFDDKLFCPILVAMLKKHIGKQIQEIGGLNIVND